MKKLLFIARKSNSPYAVEHLLSFTENTGRETNDVNVILVNVPHYSLIRKALDQVVDKIESHEFMVDEESREDVRSMLFSLRINRPEVPSNALVQFVAKEANFPWLRPHFCIYVNGE